jgi:hypothetical protein
VWWQELTLILTQKQDSLWMRAWNVYKGVVRHCDWAATKQDFLRDINEVMDNKVGVDSVRLHSPVRTRVCVQIGWRDRLTAMQCHVMDRRPPRRRLKMWDSW